MAIKKTYTFRGIELPDAYWVVNSVDYRKGLKTANGMNPLGFGAGTYNGCMMVYIFKDKASRDSNYAPVKERMLYFNLSTSPDAKSQVAQAYDYLNSLQDYNDGEEI
jgi:hypothetical protein|tara:strand:- start:50 stop:370 length:321 start_codon:yes stop_codon:yes gene_type:complete